VEKKTRKGDRSRQGKVAYFQQIWKDFTSSFELDKRFFFVVLLDILLIALIYFGIIFLWKLVVKKLNYIPPMPIFNPQITSEAELQTFYSTIVGVRGGVILYIIAFLLLVLLAWTFIKSLQWRIILKKKSSIRFCMKSIALNIIWQLAWILIFIGNFLLLNAEISKYTGIILLIVYLHLSYIKYIQIAKTEKIFSSISATLKLGFLRFYKFIIPYLIMAFVLLLVLQLYYIYKYLPENIQIAIFGLIIVVWMEWGRIYATKFINRISIGN